MRYFRDTNSGIIARGINPVVYSGWEDLGEHPEFDNEQTTDLIVSNGVLRINQAVKDAVAVKNIANAIQKLLDSTAQKKGYDSALSCISYAGGQSQFAVEGEALRTWRDNVWTLCFENMGMTPIPTEDEAIAAILAAYPAPW